MLLLNAVRTLITILGLLLIYTFMLAYDLSGIPLLLITALVLFVVFCLGDVAEAKLIEYFNSEEPS